MERLRAAASVGIIGVAAIALDSPLDLAGRTLALLVCASLIVLAWTGRGRLLAAMLVVAATLGASIGIGYAVSHAIESAWPAAAWGGLTALVWLVVVGGIAWRVLRHAPWLARGASIALTLVVLQFAVLPVAAGTSGAHAPRLTVEAQRPSAAADVTITTLDGVELGGWYTPGTNGAGLVLLPGAGGNRGDTLDHAAALSAAGYAVLALDARGAGGSGGYGNLWGWTALDDISGALNWLQKQPGIGPQRIGVVGLSMGGEMAVSVAPLEHRVKAVVAEGVQGRVPADTWFIGDDMRALVERSVDGLVWLVADMWTAGPSPAPLRELVTSLATPTLLIAADTPDERAVAADLAARSAAVEVWQTAGIGHTQALAQAPDEWHRRVIGFLDANL